MEQGTENIILNIIPSTQCNLRCTYCFFCKTPALTEKTKETRAAILDGTYLMNIQKTLQKYNYTFDNITEIQLWGGETTFNLDVSKEFFKKIIIDKGKRIGHIGFSSNGTVNADAICDLASYLDDHLDRPFAIVMQISCDGPDDILTETRGIKFEEINKNVEKIINYFNTHKLKKLKFDLHFKATFTIDVLRKIYKDKNSCINYWAWWNKIMTNYMLKSINGNFGFTNIDALPATGIVRPVDYTQQDGIDYADIMRRHDAYNIPYEVNKINNRKIGDIGYCNEENYENPFVSLCKESLLDDLDDPTDTSCNQCNTSFIIDEKGNLYPCTSAMLMYHDKSLDELSLMDKYQGMIQKDIIKRSLQINPSTAADKEWENWQYNVRSSVFNNEKVLINSFQKYSKKSNFLFVSAASYLLLDYLSETGLVSSIYKYDEEKKIRHARAVCGHCRCIYNNMISTGSPFIQTLGEYKLLCNGAYEYADEYYKQQKIKQNQIKWKKNLMPGNCYTFMPIDKPKVSTSSNTDVISKER